MNEHDMRTSILTKSFELNLKLMRNAMLVTLVIVVISVLGKAAVS